MMQLEDFKIARLALDWREPKVETVEVESLKYEFDYDIGAHAEYPLRYRMALTMHIEEVGKPQIEVGYIIKAKLVGFFRFPDGMEKAKRDTLVRVNGLNILYGTFRGTLAGITGAFPGGVFILPSINPQEVVAQIEKRKHAALGKSGSKPTAKAESHSIKD